MSFGMLVFWALVGWCGTPFPKRWPWPWPPPEGPTPYPWLFRIAGVVGGIIGGWLFAQTWSMSGGMTAVDVAATAVGAWVGANFISELITFGKKR